jgi:hypothetical protein
MQHHTEMIKLLWSFPFTLLQVPGLEGNEIQLLGDTMGSQLIFRGHLSKLNGSKVECGSLHDRPDCFRYKGQSQLYKAFKILQLWNTQIRHPEFRNLVVLPSHSEGSVSDDLSDLGVDISANMVYPSPLPRNKSGNVKKISPPPPQQPMWSRFILVFRYPLAT